MGTQGRSPAGAVPFLAVGNMSIDDLVFPDGSTNWCVPGGNAVYAALGMAVWGERPGVLAVHGPDYPTASLAGRIDLGPARRVPATLRNWGLYEADGTRQFVFRRFVQDPSAFYPDVGDLAATAPGHCHLAPLPWARQDALAAALRDRGAKLITADPDERDLAALSAHELRRLLRRLDAFLPSRQEAEALFPGADAVTALRRLRALAPSLPVIALKLGADGVMLHRAGDSDLLCVPAAAATVVDTTGAGDAFCGGFLVGLARTGDAVVAARMGSVAASFAVEAVGHDGLHRATPERAAARLATLGDRVGRQEF
jgi:sugar/nucleoside kinase (ribokinase family)